MMNSAARTRIETLTDNFLMEVGRWQDRILSTTTMDLQDKLNNDPTLTEGQVEYIASVMRDRL